MMSNEQLIAQRLAALREEWRVPLPPKEYLTFGDELEGNTQPDGRLEDLKFLLFVIRQLEQQKSAMRDVLADLINLINTSDQYTAAVKTHDEADPHVQRYVTAFQKSMGEIIHKAYDLVEL